MSDAAEAGEVPASPAAQEPAAAGWLRVPGFESLPGVNEAVLDLLAGPGAVAGARLEPEAAAAWRALDPAARARAVRCPYLLAAAHFDDAQRWVRPPPAPQATEGPPSCPAAATGAADATVRVARLVYTYAWHLVRAQPCAARLVLGVPSSVRLVIGDLTLPQVDALAARHPDWLTPRWPGTAAIWSDLFRCAALGDPAGLEWVRLHGLQLLAGRAGVAAASAAQAAVVSRDGVVSGVLAGARRPPLQVTRPRTARGVRTG